MGPENNSNTPSSLAAAGVYRFGASVALFIVMVASVYLWQDRASTLEREQARGELLARILFNHVSRTLETTTTLITVANQWTEADFRDQKKLQRAIEKSSYIRSLSMVAENGKVLASSEEGVVDQTVNWSSIGLDRDMGNDLAAGRWQPVRNLADFNMAQTSLRQIATLPLSMRMQRSDGQSVRWLALINPNDLIDGFSQLVDANCDAVYVFDYAGRILASSSERWFPNDQIFKSMPAVQSVAKNQDFGRYVQTQTDALNKTENLESDRRA